MASDANLPRRPEPDPGEAMFRARSQLQEARAALARVTGGAPPRAVLTELAQELAGELASYIDELPMYRFTGLVRRGGALSALFPARRVAHLVVLARYLTATPPMQTGVGYTSALATIAVLALGADGVLRTGTLSEQVVLPEAASLSTDPLPWDDVRIRRVPSRAMRLAKWQGGAEPWDVAAPGRVLEALSAIAASIANESNRDLALLQRFL